MNKQINPNVVAAHLDCCRGGFSGDNARFHSNHAERQRRASSDRHDRTASYGS